MTGNQITAPVITTNNNNNQKSSSSPKRRKSETSLQADSHDGDDNRQSQSGGTPLQTQIDNVLDEIHQLTSMTRSPKRDKPAAAAVRSSSNRPFPDEMQGTNGSVKSQQSSSVKSVSSVVLHNTLPARKVKIVLEDTWEKNMDYLGLTGLEILDGKGHVIPVKPHQLIFDATLQMTASTFPDRPISNLFITPNMTTRETAMWMIPSYPNTPLEIDLQEKTHIAGLRVWNYNGQSENTLRGIKYISIHLDNKLYFRTLLRIAPGYDGIDYTQTIYFDHLADLIQRVVAQQQKEKRTAVSSTNGMIDQTRPSAYISPKIKQVYEIVQVPSGLCYKFTLHNNHGDDYYIGLDHIDLYDTENKVIDLAAYGGYITAIPYSIQDLSTSDDDQYAQDPRIPEQLFNPAFHQTQQQQPAPHSTNSSTTSSNVSWLCPLAYCMTETERSACSKRLSSSGGGGGGCYPKQNTLYIHFAYPVAISAIR